MMGRAESIQLLHSARTQTLEEWCSKERQDGDLSENGITDILFGLFNTTTLLCWRQVIPSWFPTVSVSVSWAPQNSKQGQTVEFTGRSSFLKALRSSFLHWTSRRSSTKHQLCCYCRECIPIGRTKHKQKCCAGLIALGLNWMDQTCRLQFAGAHLSHKEWHTYEAKLRELHEEPLVVGFLLGEGLHVIIVAILGNDIIFQLQDKRLKISSRNVLSNRYAS